LTKRIDGRCFDEIRPVSITPGFMSFAEGSVLIEQGKTKVICAVSVEEKVPPFLRGSGSGWITAEYSMLPRATLTRTSRDSVQGHIAGRSQEIQRLIGRTLISITDLSLLGERTLMVDCDVIQADGGTRAAAITGSYVALYMALRNLARMGVIHSVPLRAAVAAISVGVVRGCVLLDLCYEEDSSAGSDFNIAMADSGDIVEVQASAEVRPFSRETLEQAIALADKGIKKLFEVQHQAIAAIGHL
jgi:ribonuclease PH